MYGYAVEAWLRRGGCVKAPGAVTGAHAACCAARVIRQADFGLSRRVPQLTAHPVGATPFEQPRDRRSTVL